MIVVLAGGSGFLGSALTRRFTGAGHLVRVLTRSPRPEGPTDVEWHPDGNTGDWASALADADVIVNLVGANLADKRWSEHRKQVLRDSRILPTRSLARALSEVPKRRRTFVSGSGVNVYGPHGDEPVTEADPPGDDFLARLCTDWEGEAEKASSATTRVVIVRSAPVLHPDEGALAKMLLPFRLGLGGPLGTGRQYLSWIHLDDWVSLAEWLAVGRDWAGDRPLSRWNASAPHPVTNAEFTRTLGRVLRRPAVIPVPGFAMRILFGEMAQILLTGARVLPAAAGQAGFSFRFPTLEPALRDLI